ncbi:MAG: exosortase/archaeosortase family protein, partial [Rhodothermales bacterium]
QPSKPGPNPVHYLGVAFCLIVVFVIVASVTGPQQASLDFFTTSTYVNWLNILGMEATADGRHATALWGGERVGFLVEYGCNGLLMYLLLTATMLPFPCAWPRKLIGLGIGLIFAFISNQIRLFGLMFVLTIIDDPEDFHIYHTGLGQAYAIIMVLIYWQIWLAWQRRGLSKNKEVPDAEPLES